LLVSINTCLVEKDNGGNTGADAPESVFKPPPSLLLLIKVSLDELFKSLRRQGGGIGDRTAETPLWRRRMRQSGSPAVGRRQMGVVGRGSGDQNGQGQQNRNSRIKNIFLELKLSVCRFQWHRANDGRMHLPFAEANGKACGEG